MHIWLIDRQHFVWTFFPGWPWCGFDAVLTQFYQMSEDRKWQSAWGVSSWWHFIWSYTPTHRMYHAIGCAPKVKSNKWYWQEGKGVDDTFIQISRRSVLARKIQIALFAIALLITNGLPWNWSPVQKGMSKFIYGRPIVDNRQFTLFWTTCDSVWHYIHADAW